MRQTTTGLESCLGNLLLPGLETPLIALILAFLLSIPCLASSGFALDTMNIPTPKFQIVNESGETKSVDSFPKPLLLHLWASWCEGCKIEIPELAKLTNSKLTILVVSVDDQPTKAAEFLHKVAPQLTFWRVVDESASKKYWAWGLPTSYLFGDKTARALGPRHWGALSNEQFLALFSKANK